jgi:PAS domain S-box-containing protein
VGVFYLILFECSSAIWAITDSLEHAATSLTIKIFWSQFAIIGASTIPVLFLLFTLAFTQNDKLNNLKSALILLSIPIITIIFTFTNQHHHLIWEKVDLITQNNDSVYHYGKWFWIYVFYEFGLVILAIIILLLATLQFYNTYKRQIIYLIIASLLPFAASILYIFKLTSLKADMTPVALIFSGIFVATGIYRQGMIDIIPVARKQIIDNLSDGIIVVDMADRIIDTNPAIAAMTGSRLEDLIGKPFKNISDIIFHPGIDYSTNAIFTTETVITIDKEPRFYEVTYNPVSGINQNLIGKIFILHDFTKRKVALDSAVESNDRLRKEITEKEKLIVDLDAYARSVAHDLKNPISGLLSLSEVIKDDFFNERQEEAFESLDMAHEQTLKMYKIVDELLLLSRIRKEDIKPVALDMASIFNEALKRMNGQLDEKNITIATPDSWPIVLGHTQWIEEVWFNFISNAVKYGGNPPLIKTGYDKVNDFAYRFWIQDNGNGLPPESFLKVFNDFERLGRKNVEGHGFGLSIVKRIIEKLGGEVSVSSENSPGKGCIFSFTLNANPKTVTSNGDPLEQATQQHRNTEL